MVAVGAARHRRAMSGAQAYAVAGVGTLGPLTNHHEIDVAGVGEWRRDSRVDPRRTQVDVVVELEAEPEQQPALEDARGEPGISRPSPDRAEEDRVVT